MEDFRYICASTHHFDELKQFNDGRVEEVVSGAIVQQGIDNRLKQVSFDDVAVIIFILQAYDSTHEPQGTLEMNKCPFLCVVKIPCKWKDSLCAGLTEREEGVFGVHEHQHSSEQVFVHDVGLDVISVVLHTEGQELQDQSQQLSRLEVV